MTKSEIRKIIREELYTRPMGMMDPILDKNKSVEEIVSDLQSLVMKYGKRDAQLKETLFYAINYIENHGNN